MCGTCEASRQRDPEGRARFEREAPRYAEQYGVPVEQVLCHGFYLDLLWSRMAGLSD